MTLERLAVTLEIAGFLGDLMCLPIPSVPYSVLAWMALSMEAFRQSGHRQRASVVAGSTAGKFIHQQREQPAVTSHAKPFPHAAQTLFVDFRHVG
jgi:hypothetical protein